jgi:hypothetical protein
LADFPWNLRKSFFLIFFICDGQKTETLFPNPFRFAVTFHNSWWEFFCDCVHVYGHGLDRRHWCNSYFLVQFNCQHFKIKM